MILNCRGGDAEPLVGHTGLKHYESDQGPKLEVHPMFTSVVLSLPLLTTHITVQATLSHLCDLPLTFSPSCRSCDSLFIPQNPIWASFAPWTFLTTHLKSTCFLIYYSYCMNHISFSYLAINLTLPLDYDLLGTWTMSYSALKLHPIGHFLLHHSISI